MLRVASPLLGPAVLTLLRILLATITLALIMRAVGQRWPWQDWRELSLLSLFALALPFFLFSWAALRLPAGYSALFNPMAVLFGALASAWLKEDQLTPLKLLGCALGFSGVALVVQLGPIQPTPEVLLGVGAALLATFCFGLSAPMMKRATRRMEPLAITALMHAIAAALLLPFGAVELPQAQFTPLVLALVLVLGVGTSGLAMWAHLRIMRHVTPLAAMSPMLFIPVVGVALGHLFLGEPLGAGIYAGGTLVLMASLLVSGFNPLRRDATTVGAKPS